MEMAVSSVNAGGSVAKTLSIPLLVDSESTSASVMMALGRATSVREGLPGKGRCEWPGWFVRLGEGTTSVGDGTASSEEDDEGSTGTDDGTTDG